MSSALVSFGILRKSNVLRPRIIPCLLVRDKGLVKTVKFSSDKYVGDPINAVRIFNEKEVDELVVLDIDATVKNAGPDLKMIERLAAECRMPFVMAEVSRRSSRRARLLAWAWRRSPSAPRWSRILPWLRALPTRSGGKAWLG